MDLSPLLDDVHGSIYDSRILVVDDAQINLLFLESILRKSGFTDIRTANSGAEALQLYVDYRPDIVILDLLMDGMDGFECCRRIRAMQDGGADVPILIQTALTEQKDKIRTFREGATDFISKPIFPDELNARVLVHLEKQRAMGKLKAYKQRIENELNSARELQAAILPRAVDVAQITQQSGLDIASFFKPSSELGGDFWGIKQLSPHRIAFWLVDFSGHGVAASLNVFRLHTCLQEYSPVAAEAGEYMAQMNARLIRLLPKGQFATMFYGVIDTERDELHYSGAGSPNPIIIRDTTNTTELLDGAGLPLGIAYHNYSTHTTHFAAGDRICFYSDALIETGDAGRVCISEEAVAELLSAAYGNAEEILQQLVNHYLNYTLPRNRQDDLTMGVICRTKQR